MIADAVKQQQDAAIRNGVPNIVAFTPSRQYALIFENPQLLADDSL